MGNGPVTTQCMMISEVLGFPLDSIAYIKTDTDAAMADLGAYASAKRTDGETEDRITMNA